MVGPLSHFITSHLFMSQLPPSPANTSFGQPSFAFSQPLPDQKERKTNDVSSAFVFSPPEPNPRESIDFLMKQLQILQKREKELKDQLVEVENDIHNLIMDLKPLLKIVNDTVSELSK